MLFRIAADLVLVTHLAFIAYVTLGGLLNLRWPRLWVLHLPALAWAILVEFLAFDCPLTTLENRFRAAAGERGYERGFVDHFISNLIYPDLPSFVHIGLGAALFLVNVLIYFYLFRKRSLLSSRQG
jgi:hypothetical protein